jgi:hypothetical protein
MVIANAELAERMRRPADALLRDGRSPLYEVLMRGAADDLVGGGVVAELFADVPTPPGSVPALRLMAALHRVVLAGDAADLAEYYPSAGGERAPDGAWPVAAGVLRDRFAQIQDLLGHRAQTNEPAYAAALYGGLLWLTERHELPIQLLALDASAGLHLTVDRFGFRAGGALLGDAASPLIFEQPWIGSPVHDASSVARALRITARAGCDRAPLDAASAEDRLTLRSYLWPDEPDRLAQLDAALAIAASDPPAVTSCAAQPWLARRLAASRNGQLTVIWQAATRRDIAAEAWAAIEQTVRSAGRAATARSPLAWLVMGPAHDAARGFRLTATTWPAEHTTPLADTGAHGLPVRWHPGARDIA